MTPRFPRFIVWLCTAGLVGSTLAQPADPSPTPPLDPTEPVRLRIQAPELTEAESGIEVDLLVIPAEDPDNEPDAQTDGQAVETPPAAREADAPPRNTPPGRGPGGNGSERPQRTRARVGPSPETSVTLPVAADNPAEDPKLRLNFRGVPLEMVLDYLSDAAGFIIVLDTEVTGKVDVWSNQPLNREEAVDLLNTVLAKNGYTALRNGRTLTIVSRDDAKRRDIPVRSGNDPDGMTKSEDMLTQIIPVRFINAVQLTRDLQPLIPATATIASNEGGNAVVVTDTQTNIRRLAQIIRALDTAISSVSAVRVFPLKYADAKALATVVRDLFQSNETSRGGTSGQQQVMRGFRGAGGFPGMPGGAGAPGGAAGASGASRVSAPRVVAVADERSNSLVVSAPEEQMVLVEELVQQVDTNVEDVTELRVFRLRNADPQEMASVLAELFPDPSSSSQGGRTGQIRFGGFAGFGGRQQGGDLSTRMQKESKVTAVPDPRTGSLVVSAARELMDQIAQMIAQLDSDPAKKQKVFVYSVENTDPTAVEEILRGLFEGQNSRNRGNTARSTTRQTGNQLNNRATQNQNQGTRTTFGNTGGQGGR